MQSAELSVCPGICGFTAKLSVSENDGALSAKVESACPKVCAFVQKACGADAFAVALTPLPENPVVKWAGESALHACCPMPMALIKAAEVCAGLALPHDVEVRFIKQ